MALNILYSKSFIMIGILFLLTTNSLANDYTTRIKEKKSTVTSMQEAKKYGLEKHRIEITFNHSLKDEKVPAYSEANMSSSQWVSQVFIQFNKIAYYNKQGAIKSIKILGFKKPNNYLENGLRQKDESPLPRDMESTNSNQDESPPEGVTIIHESETTSIPPDGVEIANPEEQETDPPNGVEIYN